MEFVAWVRGLAAKDTQQGNKVELKLEANFDSALFAQLGEVFSGQVHVMVNQTQKELEFGEGQEDGGA